MFFLPLTLCVCVCLGMKLGVGSCTVHHTAPNFRCKVKAPLLPQHLEGEFSCSCGGDSCLCVTFPERLPLQELASLLAALRFPLWAPPLPSPFPGSTALLAVLLRPYSFHPHVSFLTGMRTLVRCQKKPVCSSCPQMPCKTCSLFITRYDSLSTVGTTDLFASLCWSCGR